MVPPWELFGTVDLETFSTTCVGTAVVSPLAIRCAGLELLLKKIDRSSSNYGSSPMWPFFRG
jgi:hypothetical protein